MLFFISNFIIGICLMNKVLLVAMGIFVAVVSAQKIESIVQLGLLRQSHFIQTKIFLLAQAKTVLFVYGICRLGKSFAISKILHKFSL